MTTRPTITARRRPLPLALVLALALTASCGTVASRSAANRSPETGDSFGWPPFASLGHDVAWIAGERGSCKTLGLDRVAGVVSLPIDLVLDLALLPVDLLAGAFGHAKPRQR